MGIDRKINEEHSMTIGIGANIRRRLFIKNNSFIPSDDEVTRIVNSINKQLDPSNNNDLSNNLYRIDYSSLNNVLLKISSEQTLFSTYSSLIRRYIYHVIAVKGKYDFQSGKHVELDEYINGSSSTYAKYYPDHPELSNEEGLSRIFFDIYKDYTKKNGFIGREFDKRPIKDQFYSLYSDDDDIIQNENYGKKLSDPSYHTFVTKTAFFLNLSAYNLWYFLDNVFSDKLPLKLDEFLSIELIEKGIDCRLAYDIVTDVSSHKEEDGKKTTSMITEYVVIELTKGKDSINPKEPFRKMMNEIGFDSRTGLSSISIYKKYISLVKKTMEDHENFYKEFKSIFPLYLDEVNLDVLVFNNEYNDLITGKLSMEFSSKLYNTYNEYFGYMRGYNSDYFKNRLERSFDYVIDHGLYINRKDIIVYSFIKYSIAVDMHMIKIDSNTSKYVKVQLVDQELYIRSYKKKFIEYTNYCLDNLGYPPLSMKRCFDNIVILSVLYESLDPKSISGSEKTPFKFFVSQCNKYNLLRSIKDS